MSHSLQQLADQAAQLHAALQQAASSMDDYRRNAEAIRGCVEQIDHCLRLVGNQRVAAMSAKDTRKVMADMEEAVSALRRLLGA